MKTTLVIDDELWVRVRQKAVGEQRPVAEVVREFLEQYAEEKPKGKVVKHSSLIAREAYQPPPNPMVAPPQEEECPWCGCPNKRHDFNVCRARDCRCHR